MPELPDITVYVNALEQRILSSKLKNLQVTGPYLLRTAIPDINEAIGESVTGVSRVGKRIAIELANERWLVIHLMIAGRLHWYEAKRKAPGKSALLKIEFDSGTLTMTEAGSKKRASLHFLDGQAALDELNPNGVEVLDSMLGDFSNMIKSRNHTLKRALTSPRMFSGIGNAYSDEILHCAKLSPVAMTQKLSDQQVGVLYSACQQVLTQWTERLQATAANSFPEKVTAFRDGMSVHGRFGEPCPDCQTAIQRIRYVGRETNYCPRCQTAGKLLADRSLSRLLKADWPNTIEELETRS